MSSFIFRPNDFSNLTFCQRKRYFFNTFMVVRKVVNCVFSLSQLARNVGNAGFNEILEANLLSPSLKPSQHSHM